MRQSDAKRAVGAKRWVALALGLSVGQLLAAPARAEPEPARKPLAGAGADLSASPEAIAEMLSAPDRARVRAGIETVGLTGSEAAAALLVERVRQGLPADLLELAVETLGILQSEQAGPLLLDLASHRRAAIRAKALDALAVAAPPEATAVAIRALADSNPGVRAAAAMALGQLGAAEARASLLAALEHGVPEASNALGQVVPASDVTGLISRLGKLPFHHLAPALQTLLEREDLGVDLKQRVVHQVAELATPEVKRFLLDAAATLPASMHAVRRAAREAAEPIAE